MAADFVLQSICAILEGLADRDDGRLHDCKYGILSARCRAHGRRVRPLSAEFPGGHWLFRPPGLCSPHPSLPQVGLPPQYPLLRLLLHAESIITKFTTSRRRTFATPR